MKTTRLTFTFFFTMGLLFGLTSCEISLGSTELGHGTYMPYYYSAIVKPKEMSVIPCKSSPLGEGKRARIGLILTMTGEFYSQREKESWCPEFVGMAKKLGDLPHPQGYCHVTPTDRIGIETSVTGLKVKALTDYNATHPAGSLLTDIITLFYKAFDHKFNPSIHPFSSKDSTGVGVYRVEPERPFPTITHPALWGNVNRWLMQVDLNEAPSTPRQTFEVTLELGNGQVFVEEITLDIIELEAAS